MKLETRMIHLETTCVRHLQTEQGSMKSEKMCPSDGSTTSIV